MLRTLLTHFGKPADMPRARTKSNGLKEKPVLMLRIRSEQLTILGASARDRFIAELSTFIRAKMSVAVEELTDAELRRFIVTAVGRAEEYGLTRRVDVRGFATFHFGIGPAFDRHPAIEAVLRDDRIPAEEKIDYLIGRITLSEWEEARRIV